MSQEQTAGKNTTSPFITTPVPNVVQETGKGAASQAVANAPAQVFTYSRP